MDIDLYKLNSNSTIDISGKYNLPKEYYKNSNIVSLSPIKVDGKISLEEDNDGDLKEYIKCSIKGVNYDDFILENSKKNENTLDIFQFLWENIVLEVPLRFTKVSDLSKFHGDGWRLVSEDELTKNNPFSELLDNLKEE